MVQKKNGVFKKQVTLYIAVSIFAIFIGSQITEGALLIPYWKSLSTSDFYTYYQKFGPSIGQFYTVLTVVAALIPIGLSIYCKRISSSAFKLALTSTFFAALFIIAFYVYFKSTNELFYQSALNEIELKNELVTWTYWHWGRIVLEFLSLVFLIIAMAKIQNAHVD